MCLFLFVTAIFASVDVSEDTNTTKSNISAITQVVVVEDYTNTVIYSVGTTATMVRVPLDAELKQFTDSVTYTRVVNYIPTLYKVLKAYANPPAPTPYQVVPEPTKPLKIFVFKPGIMIGCTFGVVFVLGWIYTEFCRKHRVVHAPPAPVAPKKESDSSDSSMSSIDKMKPKSKRAPAPKKTPGVQRARSGTGSTRPKAVPAAQKPSGKKQARSGNARPASGRPSGNKARPASQRPAQKRKK